MTENEVPIGYNGPGSIIEQAGDHGYYTSFADNVNTAAGTAPISSVQAALYGGDATEVGPQDYKIKGN
jgi:hypothetical protein